METYKVYYRSEGYLEKMLVFTWDVEQIWSEVKARCPSCTALVNIVKLNQRGIYGNATDYTWACDLLREFSRSDKR